MKLGTLRAESNECNSTITTSLVLYSILIVFLSFLSFLSSFFFFFDGDVWDLLLNMGRSGHFLIGS